MIRRSAIVTVEVVAGLAAVIVLLAGAAAWRLSQGPVSVGFLTPYVVEALAEEASFDIEVRDTIVAWGGWDRPIGLRVIDAVVKRKDGKRLATLPEVSIGFSFQALLLGRFEPESFDFLRPRIRAQRMQDGELSFGIGEHTDGSGEFVTQVIEALLGSPDPDRPFGRLSRISILDADIAVDDKLLNLSWGAPQANLFLARVPSGLDVLFDLDLDLGDQNPRVRGRADFDKAKKVIRLESDLTNLWPHRLAGKVAMLRPVAPVRVPVSGNWRATVNTRGDVLAASFDLRAESGEIVLPDIYREALPVKSLSARGRIERGPDRYVLDAFRADLYGPVLEAKATAAAEAEGTGVQAGIRLSGIPVSRLEKFWPPSVARGGRSWVLENIDAGDVRSAAVDLSLLAPHGDGAPVKLRSARATFEFANVSVHYLKPMPPVTGISGTAVYDGDRIAFKVTSGAANALTVDEGKIDLADLGGADERIAIEVVLRGPLKNALELVDHPRLDLLKSFDIDPGSVSGEAATRLAVKFPLIASLKFADVDIKAAANLQGVNVPGAAFGKTLSDGDLTLLVDKGGMNVEGRAVIADSESDISWFENFRDGADPVRSYRIKAAVPDLAKVGLGIDFEPYVTGAVDVDLTYAESPDRTGTLSGRVGLSQSQLSIPFLGWVKPPGDFGEAVLTATFVGGKVVTLPAFQLHTNHLRAKGNFTFDPAKGTLRRASFQELVFGATSVRGTVDGDIDRGYDIAIEGPGLDATPWFKRKKGAADAAETALPPLNVTARVDRLWMTEGRPLENADAAFVYRAGVFASGDFSAAVTGGGKLSLRIEPKGEDRQLVLESDDAGGLLRALDVFDTMEGGRMTLVATRGPETGKDPWDGNLMLKDFRLIEAPVLARLLTVASLTAIGDLLSGKGMKFERFEVPFSMRDERLDVKDARAIGSELGIAADGTVDFAKDAIDLRGTLVPAYTINSLLGNIPVIGELLTGGKGGGVFAVTYAVKGPLEAPEVIVNPLSAFAPGFLRHLLTGEGEPVAPATPQVE